MSMSKTETLHIRVEPELKANVEATLNQLGLTTADAVNMFLKQITLTGGLPFEVKLPRYNAETEAAMKESDDILKGKTGAKPQSVDGFFKDMGL